MGLFSFAGDSDEEGVGAHPTQMAIVVLVLKVITAHCYSLGLGRSCVLRVYGNFNLPQADLLRRGTKDLLQETTSRSGASKPWEVLD